MIPVQSQYRVFRLFLDFGVFSFHFESPLVRKDFSLLEKCSYFSLFPVPNLSLSSNRGPIFTLTLYGFMLTRHGYMHFWKVFMYLSNYAMIPVQSHYRVLEGFKFILTESP